MQKILKGVMYQLLKAEIDENLGREKYGRTDNESEKNYRNWHSKKGVRSSHRKVPIEILRDRKS